jgi:hypothetical protein
MSNDYADGRNAGWNRTEVTLEGAHANHAIRNPIPASASADYVQGYRDGVELGVSGFNPDGTRQ